MLGRLATLAAPDGGVLVAAFALLLCASLAELGIPYLVSTCLVSASQGDAGRAAFALSVQRLGVVALVYGLFSGARGCGLCLSHLPPNPTLGHERGSAEERRSRANLTTLTQPEYVPRGLPQQEKPPEYPHTTPRHHLRNPAPTPGTPMRRYAFSICNQRMVRRLRDGAYRALITQSMGWLDTQNIGELTSRLNSDSNTVANTLGLNVNILLRNALQVMFQV